MAADFHTEDRKDRPNHTIIWLDSRSALEWIWEKLPEWLHWITTEPKPIGPGDIGVDLETSEVGAVVHGMIRDGLVPGRAI